MCNIIKKWNDIGNSIISSVDLSHFAGASTLYPGTATTIRNDFGATFFKQGKNNH